MYAYYVISPVLNLNYDKGDSKYMSVDNFNKITPINGFDTDENNAMQNTYAWSMAELGEYLYVGTGRNVFYTLFLVSGIPAPPDITPDFIDYRAEIWRINKGNLAAGWERVFKAPDGVTGLRYMISYTDPSGVTALYVGSYSTPEPQRVRVYRSIDGLNWIETSDANLQGGSTRSMTIHINGKLYMSTVDELSLSQESYIYEYIPPAASTPQGSWKRVTVSPSTPGFDASKNPRGQITRIQSFNGHLYAGGANQGGFELWRTEGTDPIVNNWKLVIDKGAGDALNTIPLTIGVFKEYLYVGANPFPFVQQFKAFDLIRIDKNDKWELVMGGQPVQPTNPTTGTRGEPISGLSSGAGNPFNIYCWQLTEYEGELYLGTCDYYIAIQQIITTLPQNIFSGFDLMKSPDGIEWLLITANGLENPHNYGARLLFDSTNGHLYLGTANPFQGCEVWENILL